jgi:hypothetical protein
MEPLGPWACLIPFFVPQRFRVGRSNGAPQQFQPPNWAGEAWLHKLIHLVCLGIDGLNCYSWLIFVPFIWRLDHSTHNSEWKKDDPLISFECQKMLGTSRYRPEPTLPLPAALGCCTTPCATEVADPWCFWCEIGERWPWGISSSQHHSASSNHQPSIQTSSSHLQVP